MNYARTQEKKDKEKISYHVQVGKSTTAASGACKLPANTVCIIVEGQGRVTSYTAIMSSSFLVHEWKVRSMMEGRGSSQMRLEDVRFNEAPYTREYGRFQVV